MNKFVMFVPVAILLLAGIGLMSQAFAAFSITMDTDKSVYDHATIITITGHVDPVDPGSAVSLMCKSPVGGVCGIQQLDVNDDGSFSATINTSTALMKYDGTYLIDAHYVDAKTTVSVELTNALETYEDGTTVAGTAVAGTTITGTLETDDGTLYELGTGQIEYAVTCNATPSFYVNADDNSIVIHIEPTNNGVLTVTLHEELIKPFEDGTFVVIVDNQEMEDYSQLGNTLTIPCLAGTEKIEIHGSWAIPEFGVIAAMILAVAIVSIIVVTAKTRLSIVPSLL